MYKEIEKCLFCEREFESDSERFYWHIKIHQAKIETITQEEIEIKPNPK